MPLTGAAKAEYMKQYHKRRAAPTVVPICSFCYEPGDPDRLLVGGADAIICESCIRVACMRIAEARR